jgi:hypothetical protein
MSSQNRSILIIGAVGILFILAIAVTGACYIDFTPVFTLVLYAGLIVVTMVYAYYSMEIARETRRQAEASVKMAKEMENQRYGSVRPVLNILVKPLPTVELAKMAYTEKEQLKLPEALICELLNVGIGPAIDVYYFTIYANVKFRQELGVLKVQDKSPEVLVCIEKRNENYFLVVNYSDMYGRKFESIRQVILDMDKKTYIVESHKTTRIKEVKNQND